MNFQIKEARERAGYSQKELAEIIGVAPSTFNGYESGKHDPKSELLTKIAKACNVSVDFLLGFSNDATVKVSLLLLKSEAEHIKKYRALDSHGKNTVTAVLDCEKARCDEKASHPTLERVIELFPIRKYLQSASAGYGDFNDDSSYEIVDLVKRPPVGTSFIIAVNGDSMEPTFHHGDLLFVRAQETVRIGEIGLFVKSGNLFIKEFGSDGLISHNQNGKYHLIRPEEDAPILTEGKIIGVCTPEYLR